MNPTRIIPLLVLAVSFLFQCCKEEEAPLPANRLVARAGADQTVVVFSTVALDASGSSDGNHKPFSYLWSFKGKPETSAATISNPTSPKPVFSPDVEGTYLIELRILQGEFFKTDEVTVIARAEQSQEPQPTIISGDITTNTTWENIVEDPAQPDYIVTADIIVTAKLTVRPGVVVEFDADRGLQVYPGGSLAAKGGAQEPVVFTGRVKSRGYWKGLLFDSNHPENELDYVTVAFGGGYHQPGSARANVTLAGDEVSGAALKISNSTFSHSGGYGLYAAINSGIIGFSANTFSDNTGSALYAPAAQLHKLDAFSHYTGNNGFNGVETGGIVRGSDEVIWSGFSDGSSYLFTSDLVIESGVNITAGATLRFGGDVGVLVTGNGYLSALGTADKSITFTAHQPVTTAYWKGITFATGHELNKLEYCTVGYAGMSASETSFMANVSITAAGKLWVRNSLIQHGLGWGLVALQGAQFNGDLMTSNAWLNLAGGKYNLPFSETITASLAGEWVDEQSFSDGRYSISEAYYDHTSGTWFAGAADPWEMEPSSGFGLKISADGGYVWTIAMRSPSSPECISWSAEYITGNLMASGHEIAFTESFWKSRFYNSCDPSQNMDVTVDPGAMTLRYEVNRIYNVWTGDAFWELKLVNPDNTSFRYYRK